MGRLSRRMKRRHEREKEELKKAKSNSKEGAEALPEPVMNDENRALESELKEQKENGQYVEMVKTIAKLVEGKDVKPEFCYDAAYAYFMLGDYDRAAKWASNTLTVDPTNLAVRVLLARLCILEERTDDGLAIFDFLLKNEKARLTEEQKETIEDIAGYYGRTEHDKLVKDYPSLVAFLDGNKAKAETNEPKPTASEVKEEVKKEDKTETAPSNILARLRTKVAAASEAARETHKAASAAAAEKVADVKESIETATDELPKKGQSMLSQLKAKVAAASRQDAVKNEKNAIATQSETEKKAVVIAEKNERAAEQSAFATEPLKRGGAIKPTDEIARGIEGAEEEAKAILEKSIGASKKIAMLNALAGAHYYQRDAAGARVLLDAAMRIDEPSDDTLRNMALVELELGEKDKALAYAGEMSVVDFMLLRLIRG